MKFLSIQSVDKFFGCLHALKHFSLDITEGEFLALLGPSGCGKTTLLRILSGLEHPEKGNIELLGQDLLKTPAYERPINTVFQQYALFPHLSVYDNLAFGPRRQKWTESKIRDQVHQMLELVQITNLQGRFPHQLSGGQKQRVALARALILRPKILLLDEPLAALDFQLRLQMQSELKLLQKKIGMTFIFVTHDQQEAMAMADRIAVLSNGKLEQVGSPEEIYQRPQSLFAASFIGASNIFRGEKNGVKGTYCLRPEWIDVHERPISHLDSENISVRLSHQIFQGHHRKLFFHDQSNHLWETHVGPGTTSIQSWDTDQIFYLSWIKNRALFFPLIPQDNT